MTTDDFLRKQGLLRKYRIEKCDGSPVDENADYFVLRLDNGGSCPQHIAACREAILAFADAIAKHNPTLAGDIRFRYESRDQKRFGNGYGEPYAP